MMEVEGLELEAPPGFEPGVEVLQTSALPLGDGADRARNTERASMARATHRIGEKVPSFATLPGGFGGHQPRTAGHQRCEG